MTSGWEKTASRAAPANTQQRASSLGRSMKTQSKAGLFLARDSLSPSSKQLFHAISRQATLVGFSPSISVCKASRVVAFFAGRSSWAQAIRVHSSATLPSNAIFLMLVSPHPRIVDPKPTWFHKETDSLVCLNFLLIPWTNTGGFTARGSVSDKSHRRTGTAEP